MEEFSEYKKNWIVEGMEVSTVDNLNNKMRVERIERESLELEIGGTKKRISRVLGVKCNWFDDLPSGQKKYQWGRFHTRTLVPWDIALKGQEVAERFTRR